VGSDDVKDYFQHLALARSEWWFSTFLVLFESGDPEFENLPSRQRERARHSTRDRLAFVAEYRLGFGHFSASNTCQRLSNLIVELIEIEYERSHRATVERRAMRDP
jgi:hypothetical protein